MSRSQIHWILALAASATLLGYRGVACRAGRAGAAARRESPASPEPVSGPAAQVGPGNNVFSEAEREAVNEFLSRHTELRVATDSDRHGAHSGDGDVRGLYGVYHPYFVRGDLNDDGVLDFIQAFVHRDSSRAMPWFSVVIFTGRGGGRGYSPGTFLERDVSLSRGDLSVDRDAVVITPDLSDEGVRRYRWDPVHRSYVFVRDDEDDDEAPVPAQT